MTDQIADLLVRIRNASAVGKYEAKTSYSKMKEAILTILKSEGYISDFSISEDGIKKTINFIISDKKTPTHLKQISKPGHRIYYKSKEIKTPLSGWGLGIVSTSKGLVTSREAGKLGLGGELICEVW